MRTKLLAIALLLVPALGADPLSAQLKEGAALGAHGRDQGSSVIKGR